MRLRRWRKTRIDHLILLSQPRGWVSARNRSRRTAALASVSYESRRSIVHHGEIDMPLRLCASEKGIPTG